MDTQVMVQIPTELKDRFFRLAKSEGKTSNQVLRELMDRYIQERDIASSIDGLWDRIGEKLQAAGVSETDVAEKIAEVRKAGNARRH